MVLVVVAALAVGVRGDDGGTTVGERARAVAASVRCPTCRGQSALESDSPAAEAIRTEITRRIEEGQSEQEVRAYLVGRYGESILLTPPAGGVGGLVWVLPVAGLVVAGAGLAVAFRRWQGRRPEALTDADRALVDRARGDRDGADRARVERGG